MKYFNILLAFAITLILFSCEKSDDLDQNDVNGTYLGTITSDVSNKLSKADVSTPATVVVSTIGNQIEVHCFSDNFDTTIMFDIYMNGDDINVCLIGDDFENMYGHMRGHGNMMDGTMHNSSTEWMQHLNNDHQDGDEHFGGFDMKHHTFNYVFNINGQNYNFQGIKQ